MKKQYPLVWQRCYKPVKKLELLCLLLLFTVTIKAQTVSYYGFSQSQGTYTALTDATTIATATSASGTGNLDEQVYTLDNVIPFNFTFDGQANTSLKVHANGYISFGTTTNTYSDPISSSGAYSGVVSPLAADINSLYDVNGNTGIITYQVTGTAPNREFVVQWSHFKPYSSSATATSYHDWNFQARLKEDGSVNFVYNLLTTGTPSATNAKVGLRGASSSDYTNRTASGNATSNWSNTTPGTFSSSGIATNYSFLPQSGLTFTYTQPVACTAPTTQATNLVLSNTGIIINGSFTAPTPAADRYLILRNLAGTTPNAPVNGTIYTTGQNTDLNSYVAYYGTNTSFENNYNNGIRGNNQYFYTIYAVNSNCNGGPLYLTANPLTGSITNCPATVNGITAQAATTNSFTLNWPATENGAAQTFTTVLEVATNNTFTNMVTGAPFTLTSATLSQTIIGLAPNTQYFYRAKNVSTQCESIYSSVNSIFTTCVPVDNFAEGFDGVTGLALPNCWNKILVSGTSSVPTINVTTTDAFSSPNNVSFYGNGADTDLATTKIILVSPQVNNLSAGTHRLKFKARKTSATTSPSATGLRIVALDGTTNDATITAIESFTELTTTYQEYTVYFNNYTGNGNYIGIQRIGGPSYSYLYVDDVTWEPVPTCPELLTVTATNATPTGATVNWANINDEAPAGGYEYAVTTTNTLPTQGDAVTATTATSVTLNTLSGGTNYYVFVRRVCSDSDKSSWKYAGFTTIATAPAPWQEEFTTTATPLGWTTTGWTLSSNRGATGTNTTATNIFKNLYGTATTGIFSTIAVGPLTTGNYELSFNYKQSDYDSPYAPLTDWGNYSVEISTDFGTTWNALATVNNEAGTGEYIHKTFSLAAYQGHYVRVRITANRTAGDYDLSFDNFEIKTNVTTPECTGAEPGLNAGDTSCISFTYNGETVIYTTVRGADGNIWLQQNLGSESIANTQDDADSYGDLFQWGRWADGHQKRTSEAGNAPSPNNPEGLSGGSDNYITGSNVNSWWASNALTDTWNAATPADATDISGCDPCKAALGQDWQLPSQAEWTALVDAENIINPATAFNSNLKLPATGYRSNTDGGFTFVGARGYYWSRDVANTGGKFLYIGTVIANPASGAPRGQGAAIRCVKRAPPEVQSVNVNTLNNAEPVITTQGGTLQLVATVNPAGVSQEVTWAVTAGSEFAAVNETGLVTALANGTVTVRATSVEDETKLDTIDVIINIAGSTDGYCNVTVDWNVEPITLVNFADLNNATSATIDGTPAYENFTSITATVQKGQTYPVTVKGNTAGEFEHDVRVFIDWNQDNAFNMETEYYTASLLPSTGEDTVEVSINITVPDNALLGNTRMRITKDMWNVYEEGEFDACTNAYYGQIEDYTVNVQESLGLPDYDSVNFSLYPNPTQNMVTVVSTIGTSLIKVYNQLGQLVTTAVKSNTVDLKNVAAGIYIVEIHFDNGTISSKKVIKN